MSQTPVDDEYRWHVAVVIMAIIGALILGAIYINGCDECEAKGGVLVETATGFACVEKK